MYCKQCGSNKHFDRECPENYEPGPEESAKLLAKACKAIKEREMEQLELDLETREEKLIKKAFKIGFQRGAKRLESTASLDQEADYFMRQLLFATPKENN